jgi:hypothetical protein
MGEPLPLPLLQYYICNEAACVYREECAIY